MPQNLKKTLRKSIAYRKLLTFFLCIRFFQFIHLSDHNTLKFEKDIKEKYCLSQVVDIFLHIRFFQFIHLGDDNILKFEKDIKEKYCLSQVADLFPPHTLLSIYPPW
jgi:hypothetical protein